MKISSKISVGSVFFGSKNGENFLKTAKDLSAQDSVESIRARQKAMLAMLEDHLPYAVEMLENADFHDNEHYIRSGPRRIGILQLYERLLDSLVGSKPKADALDNLERLERLMRNVQQNNPQETEG